MKYIVAILFLGVLVGSFLYSDYKKTKVEEPVLYSDLSVKNGQIITSPLILTGKIRGKWFFEASFPVYIFDGLGNQLGVGVATAMDNWMTEELVPFKAEIKFTQSLTDNGDVVLKKDNPSGLPANDQEVRIPIKLN